MQLFSIVTKKRGAKRRVKHHCTGITLRIEGTSTLRVITLFHEKLPALRTITLFQEKLPSSELLTPKCVCLPKVAALSASA